MRLYVVDAFACAAFGGNTAGVVLLDAGAAFPADSLMRQVAAELRYSETAFVRRDGAAEFTVRYFTPACEVDLCGHATIAAFGVLVSEGLVDEGNECVAHTLAGDVVVHAGQQVMMQMVASTVVDKPVDEVLLRSIMGCEKVEHGEGLPVEVVSTGLADIILPMGSVAELNGLRPDMEALSALSREMGVVGVHAFALSNDGFTAHTRNFAPLYGIDEESATGTASAGLTHYLHRHSIIGDVAQCRFLQGEAMGRPSVVATARHADGAIVVGGTSVIVARGELLL